MENELRELIKLVASKYSLDPYLVGAIVLQESSGDTYSIRYEPAFYERYVKPLKLNPTEAFCRSTSWGLMQVMGQVARELGFIGKITHLLNQAVGLDLGCKHLSNKLKKYGNELDAIAAYNAGSARKNPDGTYVNQEYVDSVLAHKAELHTEGA